MTAVLPALAAAPGARRVRFLPGDLFGVVAAEYLRADAAAVPISANDAMERRLGEGKIFWRKPRSVRHMSSPRSTICELPASISASLVGKLMADF